MSTRRKVDPIFKKEATLGNDYFGHEIYALRSPSSLYYYSSLDHSFAFKSIPNRDPADSPSKNGPPRKLYHRIPVGILDIQAVCAVRMQRSGS